MSLCADTVDSREGLCVAIVPARGGSKRIPRKNVRVFRGRPMIAWPIQTALETGLFDHVVVSTDDDEIADVAVKAGALRPFARLPELSDDHTPLRPVIKHAITGIEAHFGRPVGIACSILATAVLLSPNDLRAGYEALLRPATDFAFAAAAFPSPVQRAIRRSPEGGVEMLYPENRFTRSQDLEDCFYDAGQFYWGRRGAFMNDSPMYGPRSEPILVPLDRACDIDTPQDWEQAELLFDLRNARRQQDAAFMVGQKSPTASGVVPDDKCRQMI